MLTRIRERLSGLPRKTRLAIGGGILVLAALAGLLLFLTPWDGPLAYLTDTQPAFAHPDGLVVRLPDGVSRALVQVTTIPREAFLADQAGSDWRAAHQALPKSLTPLSPIYTVKARQGRVIGEMDIPNGAEPYELLDLYPGTGIVGRTWAAWRAAQNERAAPPGGREQ